MSQIVLKSVVPILFVSDVPVAAAFFRDQLGFEIAFLHGNPPFYGAVERDEIALHLRFTHRQNFKELEAEEAELILASIEVSDVAALYQEFTGRGVDFAQPLTHQAWGGTTFIVRDPDGNAFSFVTYDAPAA